MIAWIPPVNKRKLCDILCWFCCSRDQGGVKNSEDLGPRVVAQMVDQYHNQCDMLPASVHLINNPPYMTVQHEQPGGSSSGVRFKKADAEGRYAAEWVFQGGVLSMPDLALLGPPGTVQLTLSGGTCDDGRHVKANMLSLQLHPGNIWQCNVKGWPSSSGTVVQCCGHYFADYSNVWCHIWLQHFDKYSNVTSGCNRVFAKRAIKLYF